MSRVESFEDADENGVMPAISRVAPFAVFIVLMATESLLGALLPESLRVWLYGLRSLIVAILLFALWRNFDELSLPKWPRPAALLMATGTGLVVLIIWLLLDQGIFVIGQSGSGFDPRMADGSIDWPLALIRLAGSSLVVPLMEELFWRSFLMRWLDGRDFSNIDPGSVSWRALLLSSVVFGFEHSLWLAGILAGLIYGMLYRWRRQLWLPIVAHTVTNAGLGCWVLSTGAWHFW